MGKINLKLLNKTKLTEFNKAEVQEWIVDQFQYLG